MSLSFIHSASTYEWHAGESSDGGNRYAGAEEVSREKELLRASHLHSCLKQGKVKGAE